MAVRPLNPDEAQLWAKVMATVRPMRAVTIVAHIPEKPAPVGKPVPPPPAPLHGVKPVVRTPVRAPVQMAAKPVARAAPRPITESTLDGGWDKKLVRGAVSPDSSIDLHGHTLASAHAMLDSGLGRAIARGDRVLLLVTGKPPRPESERPHARGAIRAAVTDWLAGSRHSDAIAAVRGAHPRHGGQGALYIILRRER
ncbi:Smr/MutS family protein [Sphingomonas sp. R86521]|uniref:Smr/MutS family protein n=1 Tax=Sphingomonas sp. R86521 TaxID=3093860 RepID=UPI0036D26767